MYQQAKDIEDQLRYCLKGLQELLQFDDLKNKDLQEAVVDINFLLQDLQKINKKEYEGTGAVGIMEALEAGFFTLKVIGVPEEQAKRLKI